MTEDARTLVDRQVQRVRRRLRWINFLRLVAGCWTVALAAAALFFLVQPMLPAPVGTWSPWWIAGASLGLGTLCAMVLGIAGAPDLQSSALALDEHFGLRERVTTAYTLPPDMAGSQAGQALLEDVRLKVGNLDIRGKFPVGLQAKQGIGPLSGAVAALGAFFLGPILATWLGSAAANSTQPVIDSKAVAMELENLKKVSLQKKEDPASSEKLKELEEEWNKLLKEAPDPKNEDKVREFAKRMQTLEEKMKERVRDLKSNQDKAKDIKSLLEKAGLDKLGKNMKEGPAKDLQDALSKGKLDKAREALEKLRKDLKENKLSKDDLKKLAEQLEDLQDRLKRLAEQKERREKLEKDFQEGKISKEELQRELDRIEQENQQHMDLQDLAKLLGECKDCVAGGNCQGGAEKLRLAMKELEELELSQEDIDRMEREWRRLENARLNMLRACQGNCEGDGKLNGLGQGKNPGTIRPIDPNDPDSKIVDAREKGEADPRGKHRIAGFTRGGTFSKIPAKEVGGTFRQTAQDAREALDRQRIPQEAADLAKGYFNKLGGQ